MFRRRDENDFDSAEGNAPGSVSSSIGGSSSDSPSASSSSSSASSPVSSASSFGSSSSASSPSSSASPAYGASAPSYGAGVGASRPAAPLPPANSAFRPAAAEPPRAPRMPEQKPAAPYSVPSASSNLASSSGKDSRRVLTVGSDILLKGEIATCDRLVIEGKVDATLNDVHTVEITQSGSFKGTAQIEYAEISGLFDGELIVKGRLVISATGKVRGKITYGEIEIERGGEISGEIKNAASAGQVRSKKEDKVAA